MAVCKVRGNEFVILFAFAFITLIHCRSLTIFSETQTTRDEGDKMLSDMSDQAGLDDQIADFDDHIDDDIIFVVSSDGEETLSDESDQERLDDQIEDDVLSDVTSDGVETLSDESDQEGLDDQIDDDVLSDVTSDGVETLSDESNQERLDDQIDDDVLSDVTSDGVETLSDESNQERLDDQIDDDVLSDVTSNGHETLSDESDQEALDDQKDEDALGLVESSSEGPWDAMSPKLRCGGDLMNLQLFGSGVDQVELCRGGSEPVPLGHLPPNCGHTSPTQGGLVFATPYDGCGVARQGGNYVMQMLWHGKPVVISCPVN